MADVDPSGGFGRPQGHPEKGELFDADALIRDRTIGRDKLRDDVFPPPPSTDPRKDLVEPSFHPDPAARAEEIGDVSDRSVARGRHNHDRSYQRTSSMRVTATESDYTDPISNLSDAVLLPQPGDTDRVDYNLRVVTWELDAGALGVTPGPMIVWARYSTDAGLTFGEPVIVGRVPPGSTQLIYRAEERWDFENVNVEADYYVHVVNHDRSQAMKGVMTGFDGYIDAAMLDGALPSAIPVPIVDGGTAAANIVTARRNLAILFNDVTTKTASYSIVAADEGILFAVATGGGAVVLTLPSVSGLSAGFCFAVYFGSGANTLTIALGAGSSTIDGVAANYTGMVLGTSCVFVFNGSSGWYIPAAKPSVFGDMLKSVYDTDNDGVVDLAENASALSGAVLDLDATLAANSDARVPSQKAVKGYVDGSLPTAFPVGILRKTANYTLVAGDSGYLVVCNTAGGGFTLTLPNAPSNRYTIIVFCMGANSLLVTRNPAGADQLRGPSNASVVSYTMANLEAIAFTYDSTTALWHAWGMSAQSDGVASKPSLRTLGTSSIQAAAGNDGRFTDARMPLAHATEHEPGGSDPMDVDAAAAVGSLRTLGTGAAQAAAGDDGRFTDTRIPTDASVTGAKLADEVWTMVWMGG